MEGQIGGERDSERVLCEDGLFEATKDCQFAASHPAAYFELFGRALVFAVLCELQRFGVVSGRPHHLETVGAVQVEGSGNITFTATASPLQVQAHCTLHTAHCTLHTAHCTSHIAHYITSHDTTSHLIALLVGRAWKSQFMAMVKIDGNPSYHDCCWNIIVVGDTESGQNRLVVSLGRHWRCKLMMADDHPVTAVNGTYRFGVDFVIRRVVVGHDTIISLGLCLFGIDVLCCD